MTAYASDARVRELAAVFGYDQGQQDDRIATAEQAAANAATTAGNAAIGPQQIPAASSVIDARNYSAFPVLAGRGDMIVAAYHHGRNHGQSDPAALCQPQIIGAAGALALNGNEVSGGQVTLGAATQVTITATANNSALIFTITGMLDGSAVAITGAGPNATTVTLDGLIDTITGVTVSGATVDSVSVGLLRLPSNIEGAASFDGGATWPNRITLGDGMTAGDRRCYYPAMGITRANAFIAVFQSIDIRTGAYTPKVRWSVDGLTWSAEADMVFANTPPAVLAFYGQIVRTPNGRLILGAYSGPTNYVLLSDNGGASWTVTVQRTEDALTHSEMAFAVLDENRWLSLIRINTPTGTLIQMKTEDAGATWVDMGQVGNMPVSGGYKSHALNILTVNGERYAFATVMSRDASSTTELNPGTMIVKWGRLSEVFASVSGWASPEEVVVPDLADWPRNGYPSLYFDPATGTALLAYHKETGDRTSHVLSKAINPAEIISRRGNGFKTWTPHLEGAGGIEPAYTTQSGRYVRRGDQVTVSGDILVNGEMTLTGALTIGNLPFTCASPLPMEGGGRSVRLTNKVAAVIAPYCYPTPGAKNLSLYHDTSTGNSPVDASEVTTNFRVQFGLTYTAAD